MAAAAAVAVSFPSHFVSTEVRNDSVEAQSRVSSLHRPAAAVVWKKNAVCM